MSDTSSIICLDDIIEEDVYEQNKSLDKKSEKVLVVVKYLKYDEKNFRFGSDSPPLDEGKSIEDTSVKCVDNNVICVDNIESKNNITNSSLSDLVTNPLNNEVINLDDSDDQKDDSFLNDDDQLGSCLYKCLYEVEHSNSVEDPTRKYQCKLCEKFYFSKQSLHQHYKCHYKERREEKKNNMVTCCVCKAQFKTVTDYEWHKPECDGRYLALRPTTKLKGRNTRSQKNVL